MKTNETTTRLRTDARALGLSNDTIDDLFEWAMPRHIDAVARMLAREIEHRETGERQRLLRRAKFPVMKSLDGYDYTRAHARRLRRCLLYTSPSPRD